MTTEIAPVETTKAHLDRHGYLFGQHIDASLSPIFHQTIYNALGLKWEQFRLDSADIPAFLNLIKDPKCYGESHQGVCWSQRPQNEKREFGY